MKIQEAKKIITEYMGFKDFTEEELTFNPCSLDALVAVWEKLGLGLSFTKKLSSGEWAAHDYDGMHCITSTGSTIQEAAAISTAKAIEELK